MREYLSIKSIIKKKLTCREQTPLNSPMSEDPHGSSAVY